MTAEKLNNQSPADLPFEAALNELEDIVKQLEQGDLPLEEALAKFAVGVKLSKLCMEKLNSTEKALDIMIEELNGQLVERPLRVREEEDD